MTSRVVPKATPAAQAVRVGQDHERHLSFRNLDHQRGRFQAVTVDDGPVGGAPRRAAPHSRSQRSIARTPRGRTVYPCSHGIGSASLAIVGKQLVQVVVLTVVRQSRLRAPDYRGYLSPGRAGGPSRGWAPWQARQYVTTETLSKR